jgi:hypothetical protein
LLPHQLVVWLQLFAYCVCVAFINKSGVCSGRAMAVISEYEEVEPADVVKHSARAEPDHPVVANAQHDDVLGALLTAHGQKPMDLLKTVVDFLFRVTDLSRQEEVESRVTDIVSAAKRRLVEHRDVGVEPKEEAKPITGAASVTKNSGKFQPVAAPIVVEDVTAKAIEKREAEAVVAEKSLKNPAADEDYDKDEDGLSMLALKP